jgi:hypothetical protein
MFNLIISIIAIALVVVLAGASLYYGGDAFNKGSEEAKASTYINQAQQIQAAATLYKASNGSHPKTIADLTAGKYMAGVPKLATGEGSWIIDEAKQSVSTSQAKADSAKKGMTLNICDTINKNGSGVVTCTETATGKLIDLSEKPAENTVATAADMTVSMKL